MKIGYEYTFLDHIHEAQTICRKKIFFSPNVNFHHHSYFSKWKVKYAFNLPTLFDSLILIYNSSDKVCDCFDKSTNASFCADQFGTNMGKTSM